jgi:transcriptional regulator with XRE-family HTH domain
MSATASPPNFSEFDDTGRPSAASPQDRAAFGQYLAAGRQRANLSIEDVAAITKVKPRLLEALERGDIEELPAGVYRRAMVKGYASAVGLRPDAAIEQFDRTFYPPPPVTEEPAPVPVARREPAPRPPARAGTAPQVRNARPPTRSLAAAGLTIVAVSVAVLLMMRPPIDDAAAVRGGDPPVANSVLPTAGDAVAGAPASAVAGTTALIGAERTGDVFLTPDPIEPVAVVSPHLVITSRPSGARVTVDGIGWGTTPLRIRNLPPGVKVVRATKDGYAGRETSVPFGLTGEHARVNLTLRPLN